VRFYGFLSNGTTAALVGADASVDFLSLPRFDSPSVFTRLLGDEGHGFYRVGLEAGPARRVEQRYVAGTNVLETVLHGPGGRVRVHDFLSVGRPELRRLVDATVPVLVELRPVFGYGLVAAAPAAVPHGGAVYSHPLGGEALVFAIAAAVGDGEGSNGAAAVAADPLRGVWHLAPGRYDLILRYLADDRREGGATVAAVVAQAVASGLDLGDEQAANAALDRHVRFWRDLPRADYDGPYRDAVARSMLVLHGLTYRTSGAIIAAPTTSLPETVGGTRQWDYRFAWIRDGSYAAEALLEAGDVVGARRFMEFLLNCVDLQGKPFRAPFFHVDGTLILGERELGWLPGFRASRPVREGNAATAQLQLDVEGDFVWLVYRYWRATGDAAFVRAYWGHLRVMVEWVADNWRLDDASLWEFRGRDGQYTHSKLMCWVALTYGAALAGAVGRADERRRWARAADEVRAAIEANAFLAASGRYGQAYGSDALDAALLTMPLYGYCDPREPRFAATLAAIERTLVQDGLVYRYADDMLGRAAHPFLLAASWLARVYARRGEAQRARRMLDGLIAQATDLGLLGEHVDEATGEPRGNFPQAFSHLGVILAALDLGRAERAAAGGGTAANLETEGQAR
jgi:GH15 family glucan-1,4-alpha-glucosidase